MLRNIECSFTVIRYCLCPQVLIEQLEEERRELSIAIAEKLEDHQELMQVKIGLSMEVATYR